MQRTHCSLRELQSGQSTYSDSAEPTKTTGRNQMVWATSPTAKETHLVSATDASAAVSIGCAADASEAE